MAYSLTNTFLKISVSIIVPKLAFSQMQDELLAYPYAKRKEPLAIEHDIVGTNYAFVVEKLGFPDRTRVKNPTVLKTTTREIANKNEPYQTLDYYLSPAIYVATRFIVFLDENGNIKSHRLKWEHGEGR
jgi:hypothetical protein